MVGVGGLRQILHRRFGVGRRVALEVAGGVVERAEFRSRSGLRIGRRQQLLEFARRLFDLVANVVLFLREFPEFLAFVLREFLVLTGEKESTMLLKRPARTTAASRPSFCSRPPRKGIPSLVRSR